MRLGLVRLLLGRLAAAIPILVLVSACLFGVLRLLPVDPAAMSMPPTATHAEIEAKRHEMGLDRPLLVQFIYWIQAISQGDFGSSIQLRRSVRELVADALPQTIELAVLAMLVAAALGIGGALLMFSARHRPTADGALDVGSVALMSIPDFLWGLLFILLFGVFLNILPFTGRLSPGYTRPVITGFLLLDTLIAGRADMTLDALQHMVLPVAALGIAFAPPVMRVLRSSLLDVYEEDYIYQVRLRGLGEARILFRHALPNAFLPTLSLIGVQFGFLFGGTLLIEVIYSYPGIGNLMVGAVRNADLPVIQIIGLVYSVAVITITFLVDVLILSLNPRVGRR
jgi:ABC-type dipeptide/oligopeptide/nickel transport system permease component